MSLFNQHLAAGLAAIRGLAGDAGTYRRGASSIGVTVVLGRTDYQALEESGEAVTATCPDLLIAAAELVLDSQPIEPTAGDRCVVNGVTYEVNPLAGEGCYRYADPGRTTYRIHAKQVAPS